MIAHTSRTVTKRRQLSFPNQDVVSKQAETDQPTWDDLFRGFRGARKDSAVAVDSFSGAMAGGKRVGFERTSESVKGMASPSGLSYDHKITRDIGHDGLTGPTATAT
jgi:hypothetical protein